MDYLLLLEIFIEFLDLSSFKHEDFKLIKLDESFIKGELWNSVKLVRRSFRGRGRCKDVKLSSCIGMLQTFKCYFVYL